MKKLFFLSLFIGGVAFAQVTDTGDKVGIGTSSPNYKLDVNGDMSTKSLYIPDLVVPGTSLLKVGNDTFFTDIDIANTIGLYGAQDSSKGGLRLGSSGSYLFGSNGNVGVSVINPNEKFQIGNAFSFHDGGHEVIGFNFSASGATDLDSNRYAAEIRFDGVNGVLNIGVSSSLTNAPSSKLLISKDGNINFSGALSIPDLGVPGTKHLSVGNDTFFTDTDTANIIGLYGTQDNSKGGLRLGSSGPVLFGSNGNIGVGTTAPSSSYKLSVAGGHIYTSHSIYAAGNNFVFGASTSEGEYINRFQDDIRLVAGGNTRMSIGGNGNIGIGTTDTQGFKLGVNGDIAALEVKIATYANWPDYVFNDTYNLPALEDVEQQIENNGHLKDIPSAEKVKEEGFYLGDMDAKLLQKIEELTLYTIEQEKSLENKGLKIKNLEEKLELQEVRLKKIEAILAVKN